jgi:hypothetical protein
MKPTRLMTVAIAVATTMATSAACARPPRHDASPQTVAAPAAAVPAASTLLVHKSPYCGCCEHWIEHMREAGFTVEARSVSDVQSIKERLGVPAAKASCHTAQIGGYFIEGHVPAADVQRLLAERPRAKGLTVPGMPKGSPGMEVPDGSVDPYTVELVAEDGSTTVFSTHGD